MAEHPCRGPRPVPEHPAGASGTGQGGQADAVTELEGVVARIVQQYRRSIAERAAALRPGMSPGTFKTFVAICHTGPLTPSALAEQMMLDRAQVSRTVRDLEEDGLVVRETDPQDRRSTLLSATASGQERLRAARDGAHGRGLREDLAHWELEDVRTLTALLSRFADAREGHADRADS